MPKLSELVSKYIITPAVLKTFAPDVQRIVESEAQKQLLMTGLQKVQGSPVGWQIPMGLPGMQTRTNSKPQTGATFTMLRDFSTFYWAARACITKRQEQIANIPWEIVSAEPDKKLKPNDPEVLAVKEFFKHISGPTRRFRHFLDMVIEDLLAIDGAAIWHKTDDAGNLKYLVPLDSTTIRIRVDEQGMIAEPPEHAYEQWIRGQKVAELTTDDMDYLMLNPRTSSPYGLSPLESLIIVVNSALRSEMSNLAILQEGNIPEGFVQTPPDWNQDQVRQYQEYFDALVAGSPQRQRRLHFIPGGQGTGFQATKKPSDMEFREFEEWLTIKTCALFGVSPQSIGITFDINKATASEQSMLTRNESIQPLAYALQEYFDEIIQNFLGFKGLKFQFQGFDVRDDEKESNISKAYISTGVLSINEVREQLGKEPVEGGDKHIILTGTGVQLLDEIVNPIDPENPETPPLPSPTEETPPPPKTPKNDTSNGVGDREEPEQKMVKGDEENTAGKELMRWRKKAIHDIEAKRSFRKFDSDILEASRVVEIEGELADCKTIPEVKAVFKRHLDAENGRLISAAEQLVKELYSTLSPDGQQPIIQIGGQS